MSKWLSVIFKRYFSWLLLFACLVSSWTIDTRAPLSARLCSSGILSSEAPCSLAATLVSSAFRLCNTGSGFYVYYKCFGALHWR